MCMCARVGPPTRHDLNVSLPNLWPAPSHPRHKEAPHPWLQGPCSHCEVLVPPTSRAPCHGLGQGFPELSLQLLAGEGCPGGPPSIAPPLRSFRVTGRHKEARY